MAVLCNLSGREIVYKKDAVFSYLAPEALAALSQGKVGDYYVNSLETLKRMLFNRICVYHIEEYQKVFVNYFKFLDKTGIPFGAINPGYTNRNLLKFKVNPAFQTIVILLADIVYFLIFGSGFSLIVDFLRTGKFPRWVSQVSGMDIFFGLTIIIGLFLLVFTINWFRSYFSVITLTLRQLK